MTTILPSRVRTFVATLTFAVLLCFTLAAPRIALAADSPPDKAEAKAVIPVFRLDGAIYRSAPPAKTADLRASPACR